jgi:hypothetical protein
MEELGKKTENPISSCLGSSAQISLVFKAKKDAPQRPSGNKNCPIEERKTLSAFWAINRMRKASPVWGS